MPSAYTSARMLQNGSLIKRTPKTLAESRRRLLGLQSAHAHRDQTPHPSLSLPRSSREEKMAEHLKLVPLITGLVVNFLVPACLLSDIVFGGVGIVICAVLAVPALQAVVTAPLTGLLIGWLGQWLRSRWLYLLGAVLSVGTHALMFSAWLDVIGKLGLDLNLYRPYSYYFWATVAMASSLPVGLASVWAARQQQAIAVKADAAPRTG